MDMFKWVGRKKREEKWMAEPRRLPDAAEGLPDDDQRWLMSQEFVNDEDKNLRVYMGAFQPNPKVEKWLLYSVSYDLKYAAYMNAYPTDEVTDPMEVVQELRNFERKYKNDKKFIPHPENRPTYRSFANRHGIHLDENGNVFRVATEAPLAKGTFMNRESLDKLFHKEAAKELPLDSWEGVYKGIVEKLSPEWTMTEKGFGVPGQFQAVNAVPADTQYDSSEAKIDVVARNAYEMASAGGVHKWSGSVATIPTAKEIQDAQQQLVQAAAKFVPSAAEVAPLPPATAKPEEVQKPAEATNPEQAAKPEAAEVPMPPLVNGKLLYQHAREKTWAGYQEMKQMVWQRPATVEDMVAGKGYGEYAQGAEEMLASLRQLPGKLADAATGRYAKDNALRDAAGQSPTLPYRSARRKVARHEFDATVLVGLLRAGSEIYQQQFGPGKKFTPEGLQLMSTIGKLCTQFAIERLGIEPDRAAKIADVITKGPDPFGPELPLEKIFAKYPPSPFTPAPEPKAAAKKSSSRTPRYDKR